LRLQGISGDLQSNIQLKVGSAVRSDNGTLMAKKTVLKLPRTYIDGPDDSLEIQWFECAGITCRRSP